MHKWIIYNNYKVNKTVSDFFQRFKCLFMYVHIFYYFSIYWSDTSLGSAGQGLIWYLHKCIFYNIVTIFILTSIHFYFTLLAGFFLYFCHLLSFFKINLPYCSQRVKQIGLRSGPIFCRSWSGSKTVGKRYQQTTIAGKE